MKQKEEVKGFFEDLKQTWEGIKFTHVIIFLYALYNIQTIILLFSSWELALAKFIQSTAVTVGLYFGYKLFK